MVTSEIRLISAEFLCTVACGCWQPAHRSLRSQGLGGFWPGTAHMWGASWATRGLETLRGGSRAAVVQDLSQLQCPRRQHSPTSGEAPWVYRSLPLSSPQWELCAPGREGLALQWKAVMKNNDSAVFASSGKSHTSLCKPLSEGDQFGGGYYNPVCGCVN